MRRHFLANPRNRYRQLPIFPLLVMKSIDNSTYRGWDGSEFQPILTGVSEVLPALGQRLRALRQESGLSQEDVGQAADVSAKYISQVENAQANPSIEILHALVELGLKMPLAAFFAYDTKAQEARDDIREVQALLAAQSKKQRRRVLHVLRALVEPLPKD